MDRTPLVSIGMPVYNGEDTLEAALVAVRQQTHRNIEIIISDNGSTDRTQAIAQRHAEDDPRIRYFRQPVGLGATGNFSFVLEKATGPYFMWSADDDIRSADFVEENVSFLESNPAYVASTGLNFFEGQTLADAVDFALVGNAPQRIKAFIENCWQSHGIFYALSRTDVLRRCEFVGRRIIAMDWAIDLFLASEGNINRAHHSTTVFGVNGVSNESSFYSAYRTHPFEIVAPLWKVSKYAMKLCKGYSAKDRLEIALALLRLNAKASFDQAFSSLYRIYRTNFREKLRGAPVQ